MVNDDNTSLDTVLQSYYDIGTRVPFMEPYKNIVNEKPEVGKWLAYIYRDLLRFHERVLKFFAGYKWKATIHVNWKYYQDSFSNVLKNFDHYRQALEELLRNHHAQTIQDMSRRNNNHIQQCQDDRQSLEIHMVEFEERLEKLLQNAQNQEEDRTRQQLDTVKRWIDAPIEHQSDLHQESTDKRKEYPGTTDWILNEMKVQNWIYTPTPEHSFLWINGKKGAG